jgi:hypothetical protein
MPQETTTTTTLAIIAIVVALGLLGVIAIVYTQQQAEAKSITGACASAIRNASASLCPKGPPEPLGLLPDTP